MKAEINKHPNIGKFNITDLWEIIEYDLLKYITKSKYEQSKRYEQRVDDRRYAEKVYK